MIPRLASCLRSHCFSLLAAAITSTCHHGWPQRIFAYSLSDHIGGMASIRERGKIIKSELSKLEEPKVMMDVRSNTVFFAFHGPTLLSVEGEWLNL